MIYLDHAATSYPKPPQVLAAMNDFLERAGGNPGRSGHRLSIDAGRIVYNTREALAEFFGISDPLRVLFMHNATYALNTALRGLIRPGDRVVTGGVEHNAVMRPLRQLEKHGIQVDVIPANANGTLSASACSAILKAGTRLVAINHASNVTGTIAPIAEIAKLAHEAGALILVDAAQTAGVLPINMTEMGIDLLAFTGHKGLQGPPGTGGLVLADSFDPAQLDPLVHGGTGSRSEFEIQPDDLPDRYESGTPNGVGIAGLGAGLDWLKKHGTDQLRAHEIKLIARLREGLGNIRGLHWYGVNDPDLSTAVISFTLDGKRVSEIGYRLDDEYEILCRVGLHCAPAAHRSIGTFPEGTVRLAPGPLTTLAEIDVAVHAMERIAAS
ncbi:MAG TPA: aminotransferase class V-fold PLP-dependent enzyme [Anaerolineales bacterium]|nr:aminotransferase class V-fold PLP-dependent enzyme [Anaerolineales bacterium]